ncbi:MAG: molybdopterin molybdotransferase MoeA, partial [Candidatus Omnitrophota bacterium]|nr:molybdopterin molybdotransferase MoeA [Candidatus Omnitrophota bacterium]
MIKVATALRTVLKGIKILDSEAIKLTDALGRVLAEDIHSDSDIPGFDNSAMDGYAVKTVDLKGASKNNPKVLETIDDLKAGDNPRKKLENNQAIRIMTGALIPKGADSVVMVEDTKKVMGDRLWVIGKNLKPKTENLTPEFVEILKEIKPGENIRKAGEDVKKGELVIPCGTLLKSAHIGLLASLGKAKVGVTRKPKVAILATGDEVVDVGEKLKPGKIRSSNTYTLYTQIIKSGGIPKNLGIVKDRPLELEKKIKLGLDCDLILTSGGVSVGDYDLVKVILAKIGTNIKFWKIAMRPGKPLVFGTLSATRRGGSAKNFGGKGILVFGLPGNPVSSMVSFEIFVRPAILKMLGQKYNDEKKEVKAVIEEDIKKKPGFRYFLRANTGWKQGMYFTKTTG